MRHPFLLPGICRYQRSESLRCYAPSPLEGEGWGGGSARSAVQARARAGFAGARFAGFRAAGFDFGSLSPSSFAAFSPSI